MHLNNYCVIKDCLPNSLQFLSKTDYIKIVDYFLCDKKNNLAEKWRCIKDKAIIFDDILLVNFYMKSLENFLNDKAKKNANVFLFSFNESKVCSKTNFFKKNFFIFRTILICLSIIQGKSSHIKK